MFSSSLYSDKLISNGKIFEEPTLQFIDYIQIEANNAAAHSPVEQLISSAKFTTKGEMNSLLF